MVGKKLQAYGRRTLRRLPERVRALAEAHNSLLLQAAAIRRLIDGDKKKHGLAELELDAYALHAMMPQVRQTPSKPRAFEVPMGVGPCSTHVIRGEGCTPCKRYAEAVGAAQASVRVLRGGR